MQFTFTEEQDELRDGARETFAAACTPNVIRSLWSSAPSDLYDRLWEALVDLDLLTVMVPADRGGMGLTYVDAVRVIEEMGRVALPGPAPEHSFVALPLLLKSSAPPAELIDKASSGRSILTASLSLESTMPWTKMADTAVSSNNGQVVFFSLPPEDMDGVLSVDRSWNGRRIDVTKAQLHVLEGVAVDDLIDHGALAGAAQLIGVAAAMIDLTVSYVGSRRQFGSPIGSFQAIKHHLATARTNLEFARPLVYRAAWSVATNHSSRHTHVSQAKFAANETATLAAKIAHQCHGALAHTEEYDLNLWMKRSWVLASSFGTSSFHRQRVGAAILSRADPSNRTPAVMTIATGG